MTIIDDERVAMDEVVELCRLARLDGIAEERARVLAIVDDGLEQISSLSEGYTALEAVRDMIDVLEENQWRLDAL